jgi:hypothetical protein
MDLRLARRMNILRVLALQSEQPLERSLLLGTLQLLQLGREGPAWIMAVEYGLEAERALREKEEIIDLCADDL